MTNNQARRGTIIAAIISIIAVLGIYFGLDTKDNSQKAIEKSRALNFEEISIPVELKRARKELNEEEKIFFNQLEAHATDDSTKVDNLKELSRAWYERQEWILAGHYAEKVAETQDDAQAWGISGSTFTLAMQRVDDKDKKSFAKKKAIEGFEKAISLDPENLEYQVNLAVCYAENPNPDNPMQGIMMLLDLSKKHPDHPQVLNTLAYYGLQTGQLDKAEARLQKVLSMDADNRRANCLMARLLREKGENDKAIAFVEKCNN